MDDTLRPHQQKALAQLDNGKVLTGDMGTGKSRVAMAYYALNEAPKTMYIITTAKKRDNLDWDKEGIEYGVTRHPETCYKGLMFIDSWNNIKHYEDITDAFFVFDEQRLVGSGQWTKSFLKIARNNRWILLSATPGDTWLDYIPVFVANDFYKNRTDFKREHVVYNNHTKFPKVDRYINTGRLVRNRNAILVDMPYERHTTRHSKFLEVEHDEALMAKVVKERWHVFEGRPLRDVAELFMVMRKVVNTSPSRTNTVEKLLQQHPKLIVFYNFDYELELLRNLGARLSASFPDSQTAIANDRLLSNTITEPLSISEWNGHKSTNDTSPDTSGSSESTTQTVTIAEWNGHKHEPIPQTDRWLYLVQYVAGAEGWNCLETNAVVFYSQTYSYKNYYQAHGRIDRLTTPFSDLYYYNLVSTAMIDTAIRKSLNHKKSFNEARAAKEWANV